MTVVVFTGVCNIFAKPYRWIITERLFFRRKFHFCEIESFIRSIKYIQFNGESIFFRDKIAGFGNEDSVSFWTHMFIEAMADAAVAQGMPRKQAYQFAAQALLGSAKMVLETGMHPGELKDMVCSPAGSTIEGVRILEQKGFRSAVFEALNGAAEKGKKM